MHLPKNTAGENSLQRRIRCCSTGESHLRETAVVWSSLQQLVKTKSVIVIINPDFC